MPGAQETLALPVFRADTPRPFSTNRGLFLMALIVQKYGGTSVANPERIRNVARRALETQRAGNQVVVVVSAMSGVTDNLIKLSKEVSREPAEREMDVLLATGEQTTIALTAMAVNDLGGKGVSLTGAQAGISTDGVHTKARISTITPDAVHEMLNDGNVVIIAGFQGKTADGHITTLGRGGSDLTAIAMAGAIKADLCQIFTDVDGVYTCDPRVVKVATKIPEISYDEMLEMASSGSKVMQSRSVEFAKKFGARFEVRNSMNNNPGTLVKEETPGMESVVVRGVSLERSQAKVTIDDVPDRPGVSAAIFGAIAQANIMVDMIVQNVSWRRHHRHLLHPQRSRPAQGGGRIEERGQQPRRRRRAAHAVRHRQAQRRRHRHESHSGVASKMFKALADVSANILMISTSEIKVAVIVEEAGIEKAAQAVHTAFGLDAVAQ